MQCTSWVRLRRIAAVDKYPLTGLCFTGQGANQFVDSPKTHLKNASNAQ